MSFSLLHRPLQRRACVLGLGGGLLQAAAAAVPASLSAPSPAPLPIIVQVDTTRRLHAANPLLLGSNTPWVYGSEGLMDDAGDYRPGMLSLATTLAPAVLRYPGVPDTHAWRQGVGPLSQRQPVFAYPGQPFQKIVFGTLEFLETCEALGAIPLIQVNMHDGTDASLAQQTADWVRFINRSPQLSRRTGKPLPKALYWELGNEPYLMDAKQPDGAPHRLFLRPELFARRANAVMAAMRAVDPTIRIGLPFAIDTYSGRPWRAGGGELATVVGDQLGFADKLLAGLERPQDLHFLAAHYYMPLITGPADANGRPLMLGSDDDLYWGAMAGSETIRRHLQQLPAFWSHHPKTARLPPPRLLVTEYNAYFTFGKSNGAELKQNGYVMTQAGALFVADLLRVMSMEPRIEAAMQWSLNGNWVFGAIAPADGASGPRARPVYHAMRLYRQLLGGGQMLPVRMGVATTPHASKVVGFAAPYPEMPLATAVAALQGKLLKLMVINKDPARPGAVTVELGGAKAASAKAEFVEAPAVFAAADTTTASVAREVTLIPEGGGGRLVWQLPPASFGLVSVVLR